MLTSLHRRTCIDRSEFRGQIGGKIQIAWCQAIRDAAGPVGASLLAISVCHSTWMYLIWRLREQARSHRDFGCAEDCGLAPDHCGSELARESGGSGDDDFECAGAFAGKPAPTGIWGATKIVDLPRTIVGASLLAKAV
ncbi:hypothetical protein BSZ28_21820 [Pseudomonas moraviensis]|nr:hypothetical protein BSZ28_21820 [Pseudomonas moraviensis]